MKYGKMDKNTVEENAKLYRLLSHPKRLALVNILAEKEQTLEALVRTLRAGKPNVSQHLTLLKTYGLVDVERNGGAATYRIKHPDIVNACKILKGVRERIKK